MPGLVLPDHMAQNARREQMVDATLEAIPYWNRLLKLIDDRLALVFASDEANAPGLLPGRWHVRRRNTPPAPDSYMPITLPDGGYRPMASDILDELRSRDLWRGDVANQIMVEKFERERLYAEKRDAEQKAQRVSDLADRIKSIDGVSVSMSGPDRKAA